MNENYPIESILVADCGSLTTQVSLIELIEGDYRFVGKGEARSTIEASSDVTIGVREAIAQLERLTGRRLLSDGSLLVPRQANGNGVDVFAAVTSAGDVLPLLIASQAEGRAMQSARLVAQSLSSFAVQQVTLPQLTEGPARGAKQGISQFATSGAIGKAAVVVMVDGEEGDSPEPLARLAELLASESRFLADSESGGEKTSFVFAGNSQAVTQVAEILRGKVDFQAVENICPATNIENSAPLQQALREIIAQRSLPKVPGLAKLLGWSNAGVSPSAEGVGLVTRFIAKQYRRAVLTADVGASTLSVFLAKDEAFTSIVEGKLGLGRNIANVMANVEAEDIAQWLPFDMSADEIMEWARKKKLNPTQIPGTPRDLLVEQSIARAALHHLFTRFGPSAEHLALDLIIGSGRVLTSAPRPGQAALILLDALQPTGESIGSVELSVDSTMLMPAVGGLASLHPDAAVSVFDHDALLWLGTCIIPLGSARDGENAVSVTVDHPERGQLRIDVPYGSISVVPLEIGQRAAITVQPTKEFRIGSSEKGKQVKTAAGQEVKGGLLGLIIDARGRPVAFPRDRAERQAKIRDWMASLGALPADGL